MIDYVQDQDRMCPECGLSEMEFRELPPSRLEYEGKGEQFVLLFGKSRDYECRNCGCAFILLMEEAHE